ncbi:MAG: 2-C-methyl-D-erythritol 4-phosphate cytidylyltransferase [Ferrovum sp.]|nr:2-C-methyl-D-erythritol 4-phosphate cytidylyltransferase [Ferrovum sp.]NDU87674.1 2-C-methyl-D-erythritol 4-phosphate cytidylyltransferase [Ferrovum sp.]
MPHQCIVILPAGGTGSRFGAAVPKQFTLLKGIPLLSHTLKIFAGHPRIAHIYVILAPAMATTFAHDISTDATTVLYCAGQTRADTVRNALMEIRKSFVDQTWVLVHDAARPCLSRQALDRMLDTLWDDAVGGLLAVPVADTLKLEDSTQRVQRTVDRRGLWAAQTPQMFRLQPLLQALSDHSGATDESSAMEKQGYAPRLVMGESSNLKVTYPADLLLAQYILETPAHAHRSGL